MRLRACFFVLAFAGLVFAQTTVQQQITREESGPSSEPRKTASAEDRKRGLQVLESVEMQAMGLDGGMRAYGLLQVARAYSQIKPAKSVALLESALAATRGMDDDRMQTRRRLEEQILQTLVPLAPQRADELLGQVDPAARGTVLRALLSYYQKNKQLDRAIEVLYHVGHEKEIPYDAAVQLMNSLPPERSADVAQIFNTAFASYRDNQHSGFSAGQSDFANLILRYWNKLPKETVLEAIAEVLKQAKTAGDSVGGGNISMASDKGSAAFNSLYEYRLFQLLPVLKQLDESGAKKLAEDYQQVQTFLAKYPQGTDSLTPPDTQGGGGLSSTSFMVGGGGPRGGGMPSNMPTPIEMQQVAKVTSDAEAHPQDALASAAGIPKAELRAQAYESIARANLKKSSSAARQALGKLADLAPELDTQQQLRTLSSAAKLYLELGEPEDAKKTVERALKAADKMYEQDSNPDDPNKALKAYWPSTEAYRSLLRTAAQISAPWATKLAHDISDPEIKVMAQIALAGSWLDIPIGPTAVMTSNKQGDNMMMSIER